MTPIKTLWVSLLILVGYVILANFIHSFANVVINDGYYNQIIADSKGTNIKLSVGDGVTTMVKRERQYGTIYDDGINSVLRLFNVVKLPLVTSGFSWGIFHMSALFVFLIVNIKSIYTSERGNHYGETKFG